MLILGVGLGMVMQVLVIAVQNAVDYRDLGVATSGATLFRLVGGSLGTAVMGAIFAARLASNLARLLPTGSAGAAGVGHGVSIQSLALLTPAARSAYSAAFTGALNTVFLLAAIVCAIGWALTWLMPERPLRTTVAASAGNAGEEAGEVFGRPSDPEAAAAQLYAALSRLADRDVQRAHIARIVERAGESLTPLAAWLLVRMDRAPTVDPIQHGAPLGITRERMQSALDELRGRGLVQPASSEPVPDTTTLTVTDAGCNVLDKLGAARRSYLAELAADWDPAQSGDVSTYLREVVRSLVPDAQRGRTATMT
jgi:hypothetical protein